MEKIISGKGYFPVLMLSTHLMEGKLEIPDYQREADAWSNDDKSNLFYSILKLQ